MSYPLAAARGRSPRPVVAAGSSFAWETTADQTYVLRNGSGAAFTAADVNIGAAAADRVILLPVTSFGAHTAYASISVQGKDGIGGSNVGSAVSMTKLAANAGASGIVEWWYGVVPSGTYADVLYTPSGTCTHIFHGAVRVVSLTGNAPGNIGVRGYSTSSTAITGNVASGEVALAAWYGSTSGSLTYSNLTQDHLTTEAGISKRAAVGYSTGAGTPLSMNMSIGSNNNGLAICLLVPA